MTKKFYVTNKDLLAEIHKSKINYSSFVDDHAKDYDIIVNSINDAKKMKITPAKAIRAERLKKRAYKNREDQTKKLADFAIDPKSIKRQDIIFRVMTYDHVPLEPGRKKNPKQTADYHVKCNFPPFQHYKYNDENELVCVGKSHWIGGMDNGYFDLENGQITTKLTNMFMQLCNRYSQRHNWRGYTYIADMRAAALLQLIQIGLRFDESKSDNPFAYYTVIIKNSFTGVLNIEKRHRDIRDDILEMNDLDPSFSRQIENENYSGKNTT